VDARFRNIAIAGSAILALALATNAAFFFNSPEYTYPDSDTYLYPASAMLRGSGFIEEPGMWDTIRTPGYPALLAGLMFFDVSIRGIVFLQHIANIALALGVFTLALVATRRLLVATAAGAILAIDPTTLRYCNRILTEAPFAFCLFVFIAATWALVHDGKRSVAWPIALGLSSGVLALIRPASLFFPILIAAFLLGASRDRRLRTAILFALSAALLPAAWTIRNEMRTGVPTFSSIGATNLLLYRAAGVLAIGQPGDFAANQTRIQNALLERAYSELGREYGVDKPEAMPHAIRARKYTAIARPIILAHPIAYLRLALRGLGHLLFDDDSIAVEMAADAPIGDPVWGAVVRTYTWACVPLAILGLIMLLRSDWRLGLLLLLTLAYFLGIAAGGESESRFRAPVIPEVAIAAASGIEALRKITTSTLRRASRTAERISM
jgi:4-amino-4-deoxy-L-arabinose transferase-like glycosyltransferase